MHHERNPNGARSPPRQYHSPGAAKDESTNFKIQLLERNFSSLQQDLQTMRSKYSRLKVDFQYNVKLLEERDIELEKYDGAFIKHQSELKKKDHEIISLTEQILRQKTVIDSLQNESFETKRKLAYAMETAQSLQDELESLKIESRTNDSKQRSIKKQMEEEKEATEREHRQMMHEETQGLKDLHESLVSKLSVKISKLENSEAVQKARIEGLTQKIKLLKDERITKEEALINAHNRIERIKANFAEETSRMKSEFSRSNTEQKNQLTILTNKVNDLERLLSATEKGHARKMEAMREQIEQARSDHNKDVHEINRMKLIHESNLEKAKLSMAERFVEMRDKLESTLFLTKKEQKEYQAKFKEKESALEKNQKLLDQERNDCKTLANQLHKQEHAIHSLSQELHTHRKLCNEHEFEEKRLSSQLNALEEDHKNALTSLAIVQKEKMNLSQQCMELQVKGRNMIPSHHLDEARKKIVILEQTATKSKFMAQELQIISARLREFEVVLPQIKGKLQREQKKTMALENDILTERNTNNELRIANQEMKDRTSQLQGRLEMLRKNSRDEHDREKSSLQYAEEANRANIENKYLRDKMTGLLAKDSELERLMKYRCENPSPGHMSYATQEITGPRTSIPASKNFQSRDPTAPSSLENNCYAARDTLRIRELRDLISKRKKGRAKR